MRKRNPQINAAVGPEIDGLIAARAKALGQTKSRFVALIVEKWHKEGAKGVSEADEALVTRSATKRKTSKT
jgi:hypothetical protein